MKDLYHMIDVGTSDSILPQRVSKDFMNARRPQTNRKLSLCHAIPLECYDLEFCGYDHANSALRVSESIDTDSYCCSHDVFKIQLQSVFESLVGEISGS